MLNNEIEVHSYVAAAVRNAQLTHVLRISILMAFTVAAFSTGCVRRRLLVRTNPPGASAYVDKQLIGTTPAASSFTFYGTREIEVVADGFRTEKVLRTITPPWYQIPPFDFFSETLWPWELRDERIIDVTLVPEQPLASDVLLARADNLRLQSSQGIAAVIPDAFQPLPAQPPGSYSDDPLGMNNPQIPANGPVWIPGQALDSFIRPGGQPPQRIPEAGILPGGGYRPEM